MRNINLFEDALPRRLFRRLVRAVRAVGADRLGESYSTTFWFPVDRPPSNVVEECLGKLSALIRPGDACIGLEWWLGRLKHGESLPFHTDRDRSLRKQTGQIVHPMWSSILYLNRFPSSPTTVLDQVLAPDGRSWEPPQATAGLSLDAVPNHYVVFRGDLRHGVVASSAAQAKAGGRVSAGTHPKLRLTLLVNYWDRRPAAPNCRDYDGTIYPSIQREGVSLAARRRRSAA